MYTNRETGQLNVGKIVRHAVFAFIGLFLLFGSFGTIGAGERGVKTRLGAIAGVAEPGFYAKLPWPIEKMHDMDVRTQTLEATRGQPLSAASNDLQDTRLAVVVNYRIDPSMVSQLFQQYRSTSNYYAQVVEPLIVATVKATASQYTAAEQIQKRTEMSTTALDSLRASFEGKGVFIDKFDITDISFTAAFTGAIEEKVTAVQQAEAAKNKLEQTKYEAQQRIEQARGEAEAIRIQAQAITQQGGEDYVELQRIEKWNGAGCTSYCGIETSTGLLIQR